MSDGSYDRAMVFLRRAARLLDLRLYTIADTYRDGKEERFSGFILTTRRFDHETMELYWDKIITPMSEQDTKKEASDDGFSEPN